jgi:hypothetical protein
MITSRKIYPSRAGGNQGPYMPVRMYDVQIKDVPAAFFTIANNRPVARDFAQQLSKALAGVIEDHVEDDGMERLPANSRDE